MYRRIDVREAIFQPAAVGTDETKAIFNIRPGERVIAASLKALIAAAASTDSTYIVGDGTSTAGFIAAVDTEATVAGTLVNGQGALLNQSGGKLYTVADTVDIIYAGTTRGATNPKCLVKIAVIREWD